MDPSRMDARSASLQSNQGTPYSFAGARPAPYHALAPVFSQYTEAGERARRGRYPKSRPARVRARGGSTMPNGVVSRPEDSRAVADFLTRAAIRPSALLVEGE